MPQALRWKLLPLAFVLALGAAACAEPPTATVNLGSGVRFLPEVADSLNDAGRYPSIVTNADGLPVVAYFGFEEKLEAGRGADHPTGGLPVDPGGPARDGERAGVLDAGRHRDCRRRSPTCRSRSTRRSSRRSTDLTPDNVTGLAMVADGDTYHAVWGSDAGLYYATGSLDPATTTQAVVTQVTKTPGYGLSIGLAGGDSGDRLLHVDLVRRQGAARDAGRRHVVGRHDRRGRGLRYVPDRGDRRRPADDRLLEGRRRRRGGDQRRGERVRELRGLGHRRPGAVGGRDGRRRSRCRTTTPRTVR